MMLQRYIFLWNKFLFYPIINKKSPEQFTFEALILIIVITERVYRQNRAHSQSCECTSSSCSHEQASSTDEDQNLQDAQRGACG